MGFGRWEQKSERFLKNPTRIPIIISVSLSEWLKKRPTVFGRINSIMLPTDWLTTGQPGPSSGIKLNKKSLDLLHRSVPVGRWRELPFFWRGRIPMLDFSLSPRTEPPCRLGVILTP